MSILAVLLWAFPHLTQDDPALTPKLGECRLVLGAQDLAPLRTLAGPGFGPARSGWEIALDGKKIRFRRAGSLDEGQRIFAPVQLGLEAVSGDVAWFVSRERSWNPGELKPEVHRLDLARREWLPVCTLDDKSLGLDPPVESGSSVTSLLRSEGALYIVRRSFTGDTYAVARIDPPSMKVVWARSFPILPAPADSGARLMAPMLAGPASSTSTELSLFGSDLLVCVGNAKSLLELDAKDGKTNWEVERVWEYQRGYVGPSVWSHFLDRFAIGEFHSDEEKSAATTQGRERLEALHTGSLAAGPFLIDRPGDWQGTDRGMIVIASLAPRDPFSGYLVQQFAYEITGKGKPASVVALPRAVLGWTARAEGDHVVVACQQGAFVCIGATRNTGDLGDGIGSGPDATGCIRWYRELVPAVRAAWMECDPAGDPVALDTRLGVRPAGGGWIAKQGETLFHFPLWLVDPRDGSAREVELRVPFEGQMSAPKTNYRSDGKSMHTWGARGLALTRLELAGGRLLVSLANTKQVWQLEFDARELLPAK